MSSNRHSGEGFMKNSAKPRSPMCTDQPSVTPS